jgi:signal transduction histidine kinase
MIERPSSSDECDPGYSSGESRENPHLEAAELVRLRADNHYLRLRMMLALKTESVGRCAGSLAHDFNNVLAGIMGFAELGRDSAREGLDCQEEFTEILDAVTRGRQLVSQLIEVKHRAAPEVQPLDLNQLLSAQWGQPTNTGLTVPGVQLRLSPEVPVFRGDRAEVQTLLGSLIRIFEALGSGGPLILETGRHQGCIPDQADSPDGVWARLTVEVPGVRVPDTWQESLRSPEAVALAPADLTTELTAVSWVLTRHRACLEVQHPDSGGTRWSIFLPAA